MTAIAHSTQIDALSQALVHAQLHRMDLTPSVISHLLQHVQKRLAEQHLCLLQTMAQGNGTCQIVTRILHASGQWIDITLAMEHGEAQGWEALRTRSIAIACGLDMQTEATPPRDPAETGIPTEPSDRTTSHEDAHERQRRESGNRPTVILQEPSSSASGTTAVHADVSAAATVSSKEHEGSDRDTQVLALIEKIRHQANALRAKMAFPVISAEINACLGREPMGAPDIDRLTLDEAKTVMDHLHQLDASR